ncbi:snoRNA-binding protein [Entomophthora muscae]|uniref:SnoRNA-binding protein n=1 Tax=Entomophthora muscae TaxID=34485 RepID=A0ACC2SA01_9FUNG|nr:snoRNA-binding protein [Entomophthora muscae]
MAKDKSKKRKAEDETSEVEIKKSFVSPIATPLADKKLSKRALKLVKKAHADKKVFRGIKEVCKAIRKENKGICLLAGDISPADVISHMPVLCEDNSISYCFVPSKEDLGLALGTKRSTSCILISPGGATIPAEFSFKEEYDEVISGIEELAK